MDRQRKERLVGAAVLIMLAIIFIPMILDNSVQPENGISGTNIPPRPEGEFASRVIPLTPADNAGGASVPGAAVATPAMVVDKPRDEVAPPADSSPPAAVVTGATPTPSAGVATPETTPANPATREPPASAGQTPSPAPGVGAKAWVVQLGSFSSAENAESLNKKLRQSGYAAFVEPLQKDGAKVFKVRVGPELRRSSAESLRDRLKANQGLEGIVVPYP